MYSHALSKYQFGNALGAQLALCLLFRVGITKLRSSVRLTSKKDIGRLFQKYQMKVRFWIQLMLPLKTEEKVTRMNKKSEYVN